MRQKLALTILLSIATSAFADPHKIKIDGDVSKIIETVKTLREDSRQPQPASIKAQSATRINFSVVGLGRFQGVITSSSSRDWDAYIVNASGIKSYDSKDIILFKGKGKVRSNAVAFTGSIYKHKNTPYIHLLINGGRENKRFYYISAPVDRKSLGVGKVKAVPDIVTRSLTCGQKNKNESHADSHNTAHVSSRSVSAASIMVTRIATDADPEYSSQYGDEPNQHIATLLNQASSYYENNFGFGLRPATQHAFTNAGGGNPYTSTNANTLLDQFKSYTITNQHLGSADAYHMFSGKEWDGSTVGLAFVGVICQYEDYSYGITQKFNDSADASILAHELGHNFGAQHDTTDSNSIMAPYISIPGAQYFSANSIAQIQEHLAQAPQCMDLDESTGGGGGGVNPSPTPTVPSANPSVQLKGSVSATGVLKITLKVGSIPQTNCKATLYASSEATSLGRKFYSGLPDRKTTTLSVSGLRSTKQGALYLTAQYTCYSELPTQQSSRVNINLKKIRQRTSKSTKTLIGALVRAFRG